MSKHQQLFEATWPKDYPPYQREYQFDQWHDRKWRLDFAWPEYLVAVEIDGGTFARGRHTRGIGQAQDAEKLREAVKQGWRVLKYTDLDFRDMKIEVIHEEINWLLSNVPKQNPAA